MTETAAEDGGLAALVGVHRAELRAFLRARCGDDGEADDLLQELWLKVASLPAGPIANGRAYLFRVANNLVLDRLRARQRTMRRDRAWLDRDAGAELAVPERPDPTPTADEAMLREEEKAMVRQALAGLPPGARRALELHRLDGWPQGEVARIMGISRSGVEKHLAVAMRHLRRTLADCGYFGPAASPAQGQSSSEP
jgi:RNA polymerase sigma factor (sigma-70 family)